MSCTLGVLPVACGNYVKTPKSATDKTQNHPQTLCSHIAVLCKWQSQVAFANATVIVTEGEDVSASTSSDNKINRRLRLAGARVASPSRSRMFLGGVGVGVGFLTTLGVGVGLLCPTPDVQLDHFLHHTDFLLCTTISIDIPFMLRSRSRIFWKGRSRSRESEILESRSWSRIFYLRLHNPGWRCEMNGKSKSEIPFSLSTVLPLLS